MTANQRSPSLRLLDYYIIEGMSAFACTIFQMGLFFWARERFGFTNTENLMLGAVQGICHIAGSRFGGRWGDRRGYNRLIISALAVTALVGLGGWTLDFHALPYLATIVYTTAIAATWPALEAGAMHLPGRLNMPQRLGIYNLVWAFSGAGGFFLCGFIFAWDANSVFWCAGIIHVIQLGWIFAQRGRHRIQGSTAMQFPHLGDRQSPAVKRQLLWLAWVANGLGYFLAGAFAALTPHIGEKLGLSQPQTIWLAAALLASRAGGFFLFWKWEAWHYRRDWGLLALWSAPLLLASIFYIPNVIAVAVACLLLGCSLGLSYYMSIYYSLDAGDRKGELGGLHESIIGLGILAGPLTGAAGGVLTGSTMGAKTAIIVCALAIAAMGVLRMKRFPGPV